MRAGKLRRVIDIEQYSETADGTGDPVKSWSVFKANVWASIEPQSGRERFVAAQVMSATSHLVCIRYLPGVLSKMRVRYGTRYFRIEDVRNVAERNRELELACLEVEGGINE